MYEMDKIFPVSIYIRILNPFYDTYNILLDVYEIDKILIPISLYVRILNSFCDAHIILLDVYEMDKILFPISLYIILGS